MRETLKRLIKLSAGYSLVTLIGPLFTILLTPLYTRVLEPSDYGVVDVAMTLSNLLSLFATLSLDQSLNSLFFDGDDDYRRNLVTTALSIVIVLGCIGGLALFVLAKPAAILLFNNESREITLRILSLNLVFSPVYSVCAVALRLRMGVRRVNALGLVYFFTLALMNILLVLVAGLKATGIVAAYAGASVVGAITGLILIRKPLHGAYTSQLARRLIKTGVGMMPAILGLMLIANADRLILTQYVSPSDLGIYAIANKVASLINITISLVLSAWVPMAIQMSKNEDAPRQFAKIYEYFLAGACILALTAAVFMNEIIQIVARPLYASAAPYAILLMAYTGPILASAALFSIGLYAKQQTHRLSWAYYVAAPLNVGLNLIFIPAWGIWGAILTTLIAGTVLTVMVYVLSQPVFFVPYRWLRISALTMIFFVLLGVDLFLMQQNALSYTTWKIALVGVMIGMSFVLGFFKR